MKTEIIALAILGILIYGMGSCVRSNQVTFSSITYKTCNGDLVTKTGAFWTLYEPSISNYRKAVPEVYLGDQTVYNVCEIIDYK